MKRTRRTASDANQEPIVTALRRIGCTVQLLTSVGDGCPDLLVGWRRQTFLLEVKNPDNRTRTGRLLASQTTWHGVWRGGEISVVRSVDEALRAVGAIP